MRTKMILGIGLALCVLAVCVAPVSAGRIGDLQGKEIGPAKCNGNFASPEAAQVQYQSHVQVRSELGSVLGDYRLQLLDLRIGAAESVIATFEEDGIEMSAAGMVLDEITGVREDLAAAFAAEDREAAGAAWEELKSLWKDLREAIRDAVKAARQDATSP